MVPAKAPRLVGEYNVDGFNPLRAREIIAKTVVKMIEEKGLVFERALAAM